MSDSNGNGNTPDIKNPVNNIPFHIEINHRIQDDDCLESAIRCNS